MVTSQARQKRIPAEFRETFRDIDKLFGLTPPPDDSKALRATLRLQLRPFINELVGPDAQKKQSGMEHLLSNGYPDLIRVAIDLLIGKMKSSQADVRRRASDCLKEIGHPAMAAIKFKLLRGSSAQYHVHLVETLVEFAFGLEECDRTLILFTLSIIEARASRYDVQSACTRGMLTLSNRNSSQGRLGHH